MSELSERLKVANVDDLSAREIARRADNGVHHSTLSRLLNGKHGEPSPQALEALSIVLRVPLGELQELAGLPADTEPWVPTERARLLSDRQRRAIDELINAMTERQETSDGTASMRAGGSPASGPTREVEGGKKLKPGGVVEGGQRGSTDEP